jgi:hypothetical protein
MLALVLSAGCDLSTTMDYDQDVDFSAIKTYSWAGEKPNDVTDMAHKRLVGAVDDQLQMKGLTLSESNPDVFIVYYGEHDEQVVANTNHYGYGYGPGWYGGGMGMSSSTTTVSTFTVGTLVVDMFSADKKELIWRGTVSGTINDDPQKNLKLVQKAVEKLFKKYPPEKK